MQLVADGDRGSFRSRLIYNFRVFPYNLLNTWYRFLDYRAGKLLPKVRGSVAEETNIRNLFRERNKKLQEEMGKVFAPYYNVCRECKHCCMIDFPLYQVDCLLYGFNANPILMVSPTGIRGIVIGVFPWLKPWRRNKFFKRLMGKEKAPKEKTFIQTNNTRPSCWMYTENGCKFEWGRRPTFCVLFLCKRLIQQMAWEDYARYIMVSCKYLAHLTRSMNMFLPNAGYSEKVIMGITKNNGPRSRQTAPKSE